MGRVVDELRRDGTTVLLTTQYLDEADRLAQRIAVVDHGRIAAEGTAAELKAPIGGQGAQRARRRPGRTRRRGARRSPTSPPATSRASTPPTGEIRFAVADPARRPRRCGGSTRGGWRSPPVELQQPSLDDVFLTLTGRPPSRPTTPQEASMSAAIADHPERRRLTLAETLADSRVMAARQLRKILRRPMYVVFLFVQPVIFVLLFRYVFGGAINTGASSYVNFLMPGIIVMTAIFGALTTGLGLTEDLAAGVVDRFRSLPIARSAVLVGRTAADLVHERDDADRDAADRLRGRVPAEPAGLRASRSRSLLVLAFAYVFSLDQRVRRPHGARPRDRPVGRVHLGLPARVRVLGVRAGGLDARASRPSPTSTPSRWWSTPPAR